MSVLSRKRTWWIAALTLRGVRWAIHTGIRESVMFIILALRGLPLGLRTVRGLAAGRADHDQTARFRLGGSEAAFQTAAALPPLRAVAPDLANRRGSDIPHGGHSVAGEHIAIGHHLDIGERRADGVLQVSRMLLHRYPHGVRIEEID